MRKIILFISFISLLLLIFYSCAKVIAPAGGEKDETPPKIVYSEPQNKATNFNKDKILIKFDEYINLQNITQELIITPVMDEEPKTKLRGKNLIINIKDTLIENITYNLNFYNAIADVNEGNILKNYQFIFSTGNEIDTLFAIGHVYNAFTLDPEEGVLVMLYENIADSVPRTIKPFYITKTDDEGAFSINSIRPGSYKLFALKDANRNMLFDQPSEPIAFIDTLVTPKVMLAEIFDTVQIVNPKDSTLMDSVYSTIVVVPATNELHLMLFTEDFENQYVQESERKEQKLLKIAFNKELIDSLILKPLNFTADEEWFIYEPNPTNDTIKIWIKDSVIYKKDSVFLSVEYKIRDSLENWVPEIDSINFLFVTKEEKEEKRSRRNEEEDTVKVKEPSELKLDFSAKNFSEYDIEKYLAINFNYPIAKIDKEKLQMFTFEDTLEMPIEFGIIRDSLHLRRYYVNRNMESEGNYKFVADSGAFIDIYGNINDSTGVTFKIKAVEKYGIIYLSMIENETPGILQVLDTKEKVLREINVVDSVSEITIPYLKPSNYMLKYIVDRNNNGKWDTGEYDEKRQPDPVYYYPDEIEVKENWDYELTWELNK